MTESNSSKLFIQIDDEVREMTEEELAFYLSIAPSQENETESK
jgi:hypothetical protein